MKSKFKWARQVQINKYGFLKDSELYAKLDKIAEKWGCPSVDDPYHRYTGMREHYNAYYMLHYTRRHCTRLKDGDKVLCVRVPLKGMHRWVHISEHHYQNCKWRLSEAPY